jgi:hypothetical protein
MAHQSCQFTVEAEDQAIANRSAVALGDLFRQADGVIEADRNKPTGKQWTLVQ